MNDASSSIFKGTVIKVPDATPGIVFANGQQHYFTLERVWKSPVAPAANQGVDVEFDGTGAIAAVTVLNQQVASQAKAHDLGVVAQEKGKEAAKLAQQGVGALAAKMGAVALGATVLLWIAWFFFPAAGISGGFGAAVSFTFWGLLGIDFGNPMTAMGGGSDHGIFSFLGIAAIVAPFVAPYLKMAWAKYLNAAPLGYILIALIAIYFDQNKAFGDLAKMAGANPFSFSWGVFVLVIAAAVIGIGALKKPAV
jgi:hypothetical protein